MKSRMKSLAAGNYKVLVVGVTVALFAGTTGAVGASLIDSGDIKNGTIKFKDLQKKVKKQIKKKGIGGSGQAGTNGVNGTNGADGADAQFSAESWSMVARNTNGSPLIELGVGPFGRSGAVAAADVPPPEGIGSLHIATGDHTTTASPPSDKAMFGNEVDFAGTAIAGINQIGFSYLTTGENSGGVPSIIMEIEPDLTGDDGYSSMVYVPPTPTLTTNPQWFTVDAAAVGSWGLSGAEAGITGCSIGGSCSLAQLKTALVANNDGTNAVDGAQISLSFGVQKGRDTEWQGAIDALRLNDAVYDFEPLGVEVTTP